MATAREQRRLAAALDHEAYIDVPHFRELSADMKTIYCILRKRMGRIPDPEKVPRSIHIVPPKIQISIGQTDGHAAEMGNWEKFLFLPNPKGTGFMLRYQVHKGREPLKTGELGPYEEIEYAYIKAVHISERDFQSTLFKTLKTPEDPVEQQFYGMDY